MRIQIVHASVSRQRIETIELPEGSTVGSALVQARNSGLLPDDRDGYAGLARFGKLTTEQDILEDGDRLELLRPLVADPKEIRRRRAEVYARRNRLK